MGRADLDRGTIPATHLQPHLKWHALYATATLHTQQPCACRAERMHCRDMKPRGVGKPHLGGENLYAELRVRVMGFPAQLADDGVLNLRLLCRTGQLGKEIAAAQQRQGDDQWNPSPHCFS